MFMIDPFPLAYPWLQETARRLIAQASDGPGARVLEPVAVAFFRIYDERSAVSHSVLRDRTDEVRKMLLGLAGNGETCTSAFTNTGSEFRNLGGGFDPVGAQFGQTFTLMVV